MPTFLSSHVLYTSFSFWTVKQLKFEFVDMQIEERMEKDRGAWDEIYRNARKSEKLRSEPNERDEGELERIGSLICIYEVYNGAGAWPFLHHGSLYRGLSLVSFVRKV